MPTAYYIGMRGGRGPGLRLRGGSGRCVSAAHDQADIRGSSRADLGVQTRRKVVPTCLFEEVKLGNTKHAVGTNQ